MPGSEAALFALLGVGAYALALEHIALLRVRLNAGHVLAFALFFDLVAFFLIKLPLGFSPLVFLVTLPVGFVFIAMLKFPKSVARAFVQPHFLLWVLFLFYAGASLLWSSNVGYGIFKLEVLLIRGIAPALYLLVICYAYKRFSWRPILVFAIIYGLAFLVFAQESPKYPGRYAIPEQNPIWAGRVALLPVAIAVWDSASPRLLRFSVVAIGIAAAAATQSRGPFIAVAGALIAVFGFGLLSRGIMRRRLLSAALIVVAICLAVALPLALHLDPVNPQTIDQSRLGVFLDFKALTLDENFQGRLELYSQSMDTFWKNPFFGAGIGAALRFNYREYPHNAFLEVLAELGILGALLWSALIVSTFRLLKRDRVALAAFTTALLFSFSSGDLGFNYEYVLLSMAAPALAILSKCNSDFPSQQAKETQACTRSHF